MRSPPVKTLIPSLTDCATRDSIFFRLLMYDLVVGNPLDSAKIVGDLWLYRRDIPDRWDAESVE